MQRIEFVDERSAQGMSGSAWAWLGAGVLMLASVMFLQWFLRGQHEQGYDEAPTWVRQSEALEGARYGHLAMASKEMVKLREYARRERMKWDGSVEEQVREELEPLAVTRTERVRLAIVAGEVLGKGEALRRLGEVGKELEAGSALAADVAWLTKLYEKGTEALPGEAQESLLDRHEWFGQLALAFARPSDDRYRLEALSGGEAIARLGMKVIVAGVLAIIAGIVALIFFVAAWRRGLLEEAEEPEGGREENLQGFVLFLGGFVVVLGLSVLPFGLGVEGSVGAVVYHAVLPWMLLGAAAWPLIRRVDLATWKREVGVNTGRGVAREVTAGVFAFLAWLPVTVVVTIVLGIVRRMVEGGGEDEGAHKYPMFESPPSDSPVVMLMWALGAVVWAPLVEELAFRGLLFGWLRARAGRVMTIVVVSAVFGAGHPYSPLGLVQVAVLGTMLGLLREWRGSLIAPMVAHALHNGVITGLSLLVMVTVGG